MKKLLQAFGLFGLVVFAGMCIWTAFAQPASQIRIGDLQDVRTAKPPANGDGLVYNSSLQKWTNGAVSSGTVTNVAGGTANAVTRWLSSTTLGSIPNAEGILTNNGSGGLGFSTNITQTINVNNFVTTNLTVVNNLTVSNILVTNVNIANNLVVSNITVTNVNIANNLVVSNITVTNVTVSNITVSNVTVQNNLTVSNLYTVNGNHNTLIVTNSIAIQAVKTNLLATTSTGLVTNANYGTGLAWDPATLTLSAPYTGIYRDQAFEAGAMYAGPTPAVVGTYTNLVNDTLGDAWTFADGVTQSTRFSLTFPDVWDVGTVKLKLYVVCDSTNSSGITNLVWGAKAGSLAPGEAMTNAVFGTEVFVTNGLATAGQVEQVFVTPAITVGGSPAAGDSIWFNVARQGANASDTWTNVPVRLLKARVQWKESSTAPSVW
jgi:hypothetical protein